LGVFPPLLGAIAIYLAFRVKKVNEDAGNKLLALAIACTAIGIAVGALTYGGGLFK